jgi:hypothetical protein
MWYAPPVPSAWTDAEIDGFTLAALACEDPGARLAACGLASEVAPLATALARSLERAPAEARRDWVRRLLVGRADAGAR